ncbi:hypothetical protein COI78_18865 [Bacillus cereus]|nr:hypothetical protein COI78_18865 [Bacillus cereus]
MFLCSLVGVQPHVHQAKKIKYPKTRKLPSPGENVHFFVQGVLQNFNLMEMWREPFNVLCFNF